MSTPEQPGTPPLTRRQLRDALSTGSTAVVPEPSTSEAVPAAASPSPSPVPLARAAEPVVVPDPPAPDASVDLGVSPLTRRQARQQERIRTASVPVITPEVIAAHAAQSAPIQSVPTAALPWSALVGESTEAPAAESEADEPTIDDLFDIAADSAPVAVVETPVREISRPTTPAWSPAPAAEPAQSIETLPDVDAGEGPELEDLPESEGEGSGIVNPDLGAELLSNAPVQIDLPPSFDQLISRASTTSGASGATPTALIVPQSDAAASIVAPVTATGEVLITGTLNLPEGLGSLGHVPGTADGKEVDAVLVDGELPAHSSPTPISASAAISTVKSAGEIIQPPAPEKGNKLMVSLAITAGILAAALLGVLAIAMISGVFQ